MRYPARGRSSAVVCEVPFTAFFAAPVKISPHRVRTVWSYSHLSRVCRRNNCGLAEHSSVDGCRGPCAAVRPVRALLLRCSKPRTRGRHATSPAIPRRQRKRAGSDRSSLQTSQLLCNGRTDVSTNQRGTSLAVPSLSRQSCRRRVGRAKCLPAAGWHDEAHGGTHYLRTGTRSQLDMETPFPSRLVV
jgi:hypothetical protein